MDFIWPARLTTLLLGALLVWVLKPGAAELLHVGQALLTLRGTIEYFVNTVFNYRTLAECYKAAAFSGLNRLV